jgi:prepilin-type N-terminal cleavage/methylation domain-containing protein
MNKNERGFTLIETLLAMAILAFGLIIVATTWSGNVMRLKKIRLNNEVAFLLQQKMTEMELKYQNVGLDQIKEEEEGDFGEGFKDYAWEFKSQEFVMPDLSLLIPPNKETNTEMQSMILKQIGEVLGKAIKEITVTVIVKKGGTRKKELRYSVSSYLIDYNKEMAFSGVPGAGP